MRHHVKVNREYKTLNHTISIKYFDLPILLLAVVMTVVSPIPPAFAAPEGPRRFTVEDRERKVEERYTRKTSVDGKVDVFGFLGFRTREEFNSKVIPKENFSKDTAEGLSNRQKLEHLFRFVIESPTVVKDPKTGALKPASRGDLLNMSIVRDYFRLLAVSNTSKLFLALTPSVLDDLLQKLPLAEKEQLSDLLYQARQTAVAGIANKDGQLVDIGALILDSAKRQHIDITRIMLMAGNPQLSKLLSGGRAKLDPNLKSVFATNVLEFLDRYVYGNPTAKEVMVSVLEGAKNPYRDTTKPLGVIALSGVPGTGKTSIVENTARAAIAAATGKVPENAVPLLRIDCQTLQEEHRISELVPPPPGYIGSDTPENAKITRAKIKANSINIAEPGKPEVRVTFLLFDEIEKAHPHIRTAIYGAMEGKLEARQAPEKSAEGKKNRTDERSSEKSFEELAAENSVDLTNTIIIFTSNASESELFRFNETDVPKLHSKRASARLQATIFNDENLAHQYNRINTIKKAAAERELTSKEIQELADIVTKASMGNLKTGGEQVFPEAFLRRIKYTIGFLPLDQADLAGVYRKHMELLHARIFQRQSRINEENHLNPSEGAVMILVDPNVFDMYLLTKTRGMHGAGGLKNIIETEIEEPSFKLIGNGLVRPGQGLVVTYDEPSNKLDFQLALYGSEGHVPLELTMPEQKEFVNQWYTNALMGFPQAINNGN